LLHVGAVDCIKAHNKWKATLHSINEKNSQKDTKSTVSQRGKKKSIETITKSIASKTKTKIKKGKEPKMSKIERKTIF